MAIFTLPNVFITDEELKRVIKMQFFNKTDIEIEVLSVREKRNSGKYVVNYADISDPDTKYSLECELEIFLGADSWDQLVVDDVTMR